MEKTVREGDVGTAPALATRSGSKLAVKSRGTGHRTGRPTKDEQRERKIKAALQKFDSVLPDLLIELAELASASSTQPSVRVQLLQSIDRLLVLMPTGSRPAPPGACDCSRFDWPALHREAVAESEKERTYVGLLEAKVAFYEGRPIPCDRTGRALFEPPPAVAGIGAPIPAAPVADAKLEVGTPEPIDAMGTVPEKVHEVPVRITAANAVADGDGRFPPLPWSEIAKLHEAGRLPRNVRPWERKEY